MRAIRTIGTLLLALILSLSFTVAVFADDGSRQDPAGQIVILHTNDVHGAVDGYAKAAALKAEYEARGAYVLLADAGDFIQGQPYVSMSEGASAVELMNAAGYDLAVPGNHEFDYGYENLTGLADEADFPLLAANVTYNGKAAFDAAAVFTAPGGEKVGFFGLTTPETATKAHPAKIQGVTFLSGEALYVCAQEQVDELRAEGCDVIVCLGHLGIDEGSAPNRSIDVLEHVTGIDVFIDGHSHSTMEDVLAATENTGRVGDTLLTSTGTAFAGVGVVAVDCTKDAVTAEVRSAETLTGEDEAVAAQADALIAEIDTLYDTPFAASEVLLNGEREPGNRTEETNLGDLICDAMLWKASALGQEVDAAVTNGGGIRASISAGEITRKDINTVLPFGNTLALVEVTGTELLEALEASTYCTPTSLGGFPQVSGIELTVNTLKDYDQGDLYPGSTYYAPQSIQRVTIESVGGEAFDPEATYTIATNDFLAAGGDTYYTFAAASFHYDLGEALDEVVMAYITEKLQGTVTAEAYGQPQGRITVVAYDDVRSDSWYADAVSYVTLNDLMNGTGTGFSPNASMNRAMMVTVLYRLAGSPAVTGDMPFTDVAAGAWYADAVLWASQQGVVTGITADTFQPTANVTREQLSVILYRYAGATAGEGDLSAFSDADTVSGYAQDAMSWAVAEGLVSGSNGALQPKSSATRAQIATILMRYQQAA